MHEMTNELFPGLIPARAGKTPGPDRPRSLAWAHPRAGGENCRTVACALSTRGSSPRGRGKRTVQVGALVYARLIPARAGKTSSRKPSRTTQPAHPRAGGENQPSYSGVTRNTGSSPRGRGKQAPGSPQEQRSRLIPARAGKTSLRIVGLLATRAHPRAGGENIKKITARMRELGSSPRGRGKRRECFELLVVGRLIPARAGKTRRAHPTDARRTAHPRAGGENEAGDEKGATFEGSSPRGRGKHRSRGGQRPPSGLIPARAGKTQRQPSRGCSRRAHPRAGGENAESRVQIFKQGGSSPRGRGKPTPAAIPS